MKLKSIPIRPCSPDFGFQNRQMLRQNAFDVNLKRIVWNRAKYDVMNTTKNDVLIPRYARSFERIQLPYRA